MAYVDGYLLAVKTEEKDVYRQFSEIVAAVYKDHGALEVVETWGEDVPRRQAQLNAYRGPARAGRNGRVLVDRLALQRGS